VGQFQEWAGAVKDRRYGYVLPKTTGRKNEGKEWLTGSRTSVQLTSYIVYIILLVCANNNTIPYNT
jgi:hypothetical protein